MVRRKFKWLLPEKLPPLVYKTRAEYDQCIEEFLESDLKSARVNIPNTRPESVYTLLLKRIEKKGLKGKIAVCKRKNKIFLVHISP